MRVKDDRHRTLRLSNNEETNAWRYQRGEIPLLWVQRTTLFIRLHIRNAGHNANFHDTFFIRSYNVNYYKDIKTQGCIYVWIYDISNINLYHCSVQQESINLNNLNPKIRYLLLQCTNNEETWIHNTVLKIKCKKISTNKKNNFWNLLEKRYLSQSHNQ